MSRVEYMRNSDTRVVTITATGDDEYTLPKPVDSLNRVIVTRADSTGHTVTVRVLPSRTLNGTRNGTVTIPAGETRIFARSGNGWDLLTDATVTDDGFLTRAGNLAGLGSTATARTNLGLDTAATMTPAELAADDAFTGTFVHPNVIIAGAGIDPTGATDSTTAIQALLDSAAALFTSCLVWWPEGTYRVRQLVPKSGQTWDGPGMYAVTIQHQQADLDPYDFNMLAPSGDLSNFECRNLGFRGSRASGQTTLGIPGLHGQWWFSTGDLTNINVHHCHVRDFGDTGDGANAIGGGFVANHATGKRSKNVNVTECHFENNGRVPGVYVFSGDVDSYDINVCKNRFDVTFTGSVMQQNVIFVLGWSTGGRVHQVDVSSNTIIINAGFIDDPIEVDYAEDFTISNNRVLLLSGTQLNCGILVRGNCDGGSITGNTIKSKSTATVIDGGIATLQFNAGELQENITIMGNVIEDVKTKGVWVAAGSKNVTVMGNVVRGRNNRIADPFYVTDANDVVISGNVIEHGSHALRYEGTSIDGLHFTNNIIRDCGIDNIYEYLCQSYGTPAMTNVLIAENTVIAPVAGTAGFASTPFGGSTGNRVFGNAVAGLTLVNASYAENVTVGSAAI